VRFAAAIAFAAALAASACAQGSREQFAQANAALQAGEADKALLLLNPLTQTGAADAYNLRCRVFYTLEQWDRAVGDCEQAVKLDRENSEYHLWLGRAYGEKASRASFMSAYALAKRTRSAFEEAVRLNPRNSQALADLGEFYADAPSVVGGGAQKAEGVAAQLDKLYPVRAHELRGRIAEQRKDLDGAEQEYKLSVSTSSHPALQWMTLASFYRRHERWTEMESAVRSGETAAQHEHDKQSGEALYNGALLLRSSNRDPMRAARMLEEYLASSAKTEEAPAFVAHLSLARLKEQLGDQATANRERAAALAMAHEYKPAEDRKH
jgi:tetratricopeptide (TPR) repeat protein